MESLRTKNQTEILEIKNPLNQIKNTAKASLAADWNKWKTEFQGSKIK
jgi:hypothetical protein